MLPLLYWQWSSPVDDVVRASGDASVHASYYDGMLGFLHGRAGGRGPVPGRDPVHRQPLGVGARRADASRWPAAGSASWTARSTAVFYDGRRLTGQRYLRWLHDNAVRYVALADAPIDYSAAAEAKRIRNGDVPGLREVLRDAHWRVFAVQRPDAAGHRRARAVALGPDSVDLDVPRAGTRASEGALHALLADRAGRGLRVRPPGRADERPGGRLWTAVDVRRPGRDPAASPTSRPAASGRPRRAAAAERRGARLGAVRCGQPYCVARYQVDNIAPSMPVGLTRLMGKVFPHGPLDVLRQIALFAAAYYAYRLTRGAIDDPQGATTAFQHARDLIAIEQATGLFIEPTVQSWTSGWGFATDVASWIYINAQTTICLAALIYIYLFHNERFYFVRNMFMVAMGIALVGYLLYPTAPPRFFPELGFHGHRLGLHRRRPQRRQGQRALQPVRRRAVDALLQRAADRMVAGADVHVAPGQDLLGDLPPDPGLGRRRHGQPLVLDAVLGAATAAVSFYAARWLAQKRPEAWAFSPAKATA